MRAPRRPRFLMRLAALAVAAAAAGACQHTGGGATEAAVEYDSMQISPPAPTGTMGGSTP